MKLCNSPVVVLLIVNLLSVNASPLPPVANSDLSGFKKHNSGTGSSSIVVARSSDLNRESVIDTRSDESDSDDDYDLTDDLTDAAKAKYDAWKARLGEKIKTGLHWNETAHVPAKKIVEPVEHDTIRGPDMDVDGDLKDEADKLASPPIKRRDDDDAEDQGKYDLSSDLQDHAMAKYDSWRARVKADLAEELGLNDDKKKEEETEETTDPLNRRQVEYEGEEPSFDLTDSLKEAFKDKIDGAKKKVSKKILKVAGITPKNGTATATSPEAAYDPAAIDPATGAPYPAAAAAPAIDPATGYPYPAAAAAPYPAAAAPYYPQAAAPYYPQAAPAPYYPQAAAPYYPQAAPAPYYPQAAPAPYPAAAYPAPAAAAPAPLPAAPVPAAAPAPAAAAPVPAAAPVSKRQEMNVSLDGSCGLTQTCFGSTFGNCCSQYGWCGSSPAYCGAGAGSPTRTQHDIDVSKALEALAWAKWEELKADLRVKLDEINDASSNGVDTVEDFTEDQWNSLKESIGDLRNATSDNIDAVKDFSAEKWFAIRTKFEEIRLMGANQVDEVVEFTDDKWESIKQSIYDTRMSVFEMAHEIKESIADKVDDVADKIDNKYDELKNTTKDAVKDVHDVAKDGIYLVGDAGHIVKEKVENKIEKIANATGEATHNIKEDLSNLKHDTGDLIDSAVDAVDSKWDAFKQGLGDHIIELGTKIGNDDDDSKVVKNPEDLPVEKRESGKYNGDNGSADRGWSPHRN